MRSVSPFTCGASASGDSIRKQSTTIPKTICLNGFQSCPGIRRSADDALLWHRLFAPLRSGGCSFLRPGWLYCDKAYIDADWKEILEKEYGAQIRTARKKQCGDAFLAGDTMSSFVSSVRQPIESFFFNWLSDLTNIQAASKVRSSQGLLLHIFGRVAFAMFTISFEKFYP